MKTALEAMLDRLVLKQPPNLEAVLECFDTSAALTEFVTIVRHFLPKNEQDIMTCVGPDARIGRFIEQFSKKYFPLERNYDYSEYETLTSGIPINLQGIGYQTYEELENFSPEWICLLALIQYPFWGGEGKDGSEDRVPIMAAALNLVGDMVKRIPPAGFTAKQLHQKLDKTPYEGLAYMADWVLSDTGCWELDANWEDNPEMPTWDDESVAELKRQFPKKEKILEKSLQIEMWLHEDLRSHFAELVNQLVSPVPKEQLKLLKESEE